MSAEQLQWADSFGHLHDLTTERRISTNTAQKRLQVSRSTILRMIRSRELYPVLKCSSARIEIYECALTDYIARKLKPTK